MHVLTKLQMQYIDIDVFHKHSIEERAVALTFNEPRRESSTAVSNKLIKHILLKKTSDRHDLRDMMIDNY